MSVIGIIAEFNPFHTGHRYIIDYAKDTLHADSVVIAMGHEFTQRGGVAVVDRYTRARCAIDAGADLVVGMPVTASCASAEIFAECGVSLLHACGCEKIICGYEGAGSNECSLDADQNPDVSMISDIARVLLNEPEEYRTALKKELSCGENFPSAREAALTKYFSNHLIDSGSDDPVDYSTSFHTQIRNLISTPNNILAIEYQKAILKHGYDMELVPVKRQGTGYNDNESDGEYVSASYIRRAISEGDFSAIKKHLTPYSYQVLKDSYEKKLLLTDDDLNLPLHLALLECADSQIQNTSASGITPPDVHEFSQFLDVSDDLSDRITKLMPQYRGFKSFTSLIKNKSLTASRIRRSLMHILLGITNGDLESLRAAEFVPYLWILSASEKGFSMLGRIKSSATVPLFMSINELKDKKQERSVLHKDLQASELARALRINKSGILIANEHQRKI